MADISTITLLDGNTYNLKDKRITAMAQTSVTLSTSGWSSNSQTATVSGVTSNSILIISPAPTSISAYGAYGVYASSQSTNSVTFKCESVPESSLTVNVLYINLS